MFLHFTSWVRPPDRDIANVGVAKAERRGQMVTRHFVYHYTRGRAKNMKIQRPKLRITAQLCKQLKNRQQNRKSQKIVVEIEHQSHIKDLFDQDQLFVPKLSLL